MVLLESHQDHLQQVLLLQRELLVCFSCSFIFLFYLPCLINIFCSVPFLLGLEPTGGQIRGIGELQKPPGPPPGAPPITAAKPPPMAPPPRSLVQSTQRPAPESIRGIEAPRPPSSKPMTPANDARPTMPARGPPPRSLLSEFQPSEYDPDSKTNNMKRDSTGQLVSSGATARGTPSAAERKAGSIPMFEGPTVQEQPPAEKKFKAGEVATPGAAAGGRGPPPRPAPPRGPRPGPPPPRGGLVPAPTSSSSRPLPPQSQPPGIPEGQPLPPSERPDSEKKVPAPIRAPPNRNRAPPSEEPLPRGPPPVPAAPTTEPPFIRGRKPVQEEAVVLKRRDRDMPEFESSDEEDEADFKIRAVKQPKGLPRQEFVPPELRPENQVPPEGENISNKKEKVVEKPVSSAAIIASETKTDIPQEPPSAMVPSREVKFEDIKQEIVLKEPERDDDELSSLANSSIVQQQAPSSPSRPSAVHQERTPFVPPPPSIYERDFDPSTRLSRFLNPGRLSMRLKTCENLRRKEDTSKNPRTDPFIKIKLGAADRHGWKQSETLRKQTDSPNFNDEVIYFDVIDPKDYILQDDLTMTLEIWNKSTFKDEVMGTVTMSVVRFFRQPYTSFLENIPLSFPGGRASNAKVSLEISFMDSFIHSCMNSFIFFFVESLHSYYLYINCILSNT